MCPGMLQECKVSTYSCMFPKKKKKKKKGRVPKLTLGFYQQTFSPFIESNKLSTVWIQPLTDPSRLQNKTSGCHQKLFKYYKNKINCTNMPFCLRLLLCNTFTHIYYIDNHMTQSKRNKIQQKTFSLIERANNQSNIKSQNQLNNVYQLYNWQSLMSTDERDGYMCLVFASQQFTVKNYQDHCVCLDSCTAAEFGECLTLAFCDGALGVVFVQ